MVPFFGKFVPLLNLTKVVHVVQESTQLHAIEKSYTMATDFWTLNYTCIGRMCRTVCGRHLQDLEQLLVSGGAFTAQQTGWNAAVHASVSRLLPLIRH